MHQWYQNYTAVIFALLLPMGAAAENWICGEDLNGNGDIDQTTESSSCVINGADKLCPVNAVACTPGPTAATYSCPLGPSYACVDNAGTYQCSKNACVDLDATPPVSQPPLNSDMLVDDGPRAPDGSCMGTVLLFSGRSMSCDLAGVSTAYKNCCKNTGEVMYDDQGKDGMGSQIKTLSNLYESVTQGRIEYEAAIALGNPATMAANKAASKIAGELGPLVDNPLLNPAAMATAVIDYFQDNCGAESTETGLLNGSGFCYEVGSYCRESWPLMGCVQKSKSYCCFNSKLGRIIHEQGRNQLLAFPGGDWGNAENPNCRGFTPEEFQSIDFSKVDFSEYYSNLVPDSQIEVNTKIQDGVNGYMDQMD